MTLVVANPELLLDEVRHPRASPQRSLVAQCLRPAHQQSFQAFELRRAQPGLSSGASSLLEARLAPLPILRRPAHHGLPGHLHTSGHLGLVQAFVQRADGLETALLQRPEIASNSGWVPHTRIDAVSPQKVTLYYARVNKCSASSAQFAG